ncbi:MAG: pimeloyl-ACP methyl ester carboxylesterase [Candidatus Azotimanducaceae bacterium]|jgi:pimeloyl-ACP methyl ester carboxylesterase
MSLLSSIEGKLMTHHITLATLLTTFLVAALIPLSNAYAANAEKAIPRYLDASRDVQNEEIDVTLFRGAANNSYFEVYWKALPEEGADEVEMEARMVDLRPERDVTLHVEIYNPNGTIPLIVTPGGNGDTNGFRGFARNIAAAAPEFKVIIYDRRNLGLSQVTFGSEPQMVEEGEDLHVLIERLGVAPTALYGMSSGARSNMILASRYPDDIAALVIAPLTGGTYAAARLSEDYFFKFLPEKKLTTRQHISGLPLTTMEALAKTDLWSGYLDRNTPENRERFFNADINDFLTAMKTTGDHLQATRYQTALGMTDDELAALKIPATLILHHGQYSDNLHPITNTRAATTMLANSSFKFAPLLPEILEALLPFVKEHTPKLKK